MFAFLDIVLLKHYIEYIYFNIKLPRTQAMNQQERASIVAIITSFMLNTYVIVRLLQLFGAGALSGEDASMVWAKAVVWVIPAAIVLTVVLNGMFSMFSKDQNPKNIIDERDRQFQLRGLHITLISIGIGFMTMIVVLALGWTAVAGLTLLYASCAAGDLIGNAVRFGSYRIGA